MKGQGGKLLGSRRALKQISRKNLWVHLSYEPNMSYGTSEFRFHCEIQRRKLIMSYGLKELENKSGSLETITEESMYNGLCPSICTECGAIMNMEPDQDRGWCEECQSNTVKSALVLAGMI